MKLFQVLTCHSWGLGVVNENVVCEYSCLSSLLVAGLDVLPGGMSLLSDRNSVLMT